MRIVKVSKLAARVLSLVVAIKLVSYKAHEACWAVEGDFRPFKIVNDQVTSQYDLIMPDDFAQPIPLVLFKMKDMFVNVHKDLQTCMVYYLILNSILVFVSTIDLFNTENIKGIMSKLNKLASIVPMFFIPLIVFFIFTLRKFTTEVCFCKYEEGYFALRKLWLDSGSTIEGVKLTDYNKMHH